MSDGDFDLSGPEMLDRSSADFDHALRDIDRRSPVPLFDGVKDFDDDGVAGREGTGSNVPVLGRGRSNTDLGGTVSTGLNAELGSEHPQRDGDAVWGSKTRKAYGLTC